MYNVNLKNMYICLRSYFTEYDFVLFDGLSVVDVSIFKIKENDEQEDIFIGTCKIPYELCFNNDFYSINVLIKGAINGEEL